MRKTAIVLTLIFIASNAWTDISPSPIILKSIMTDAVCEIQMVTETVDVDLYKDSSFVSCTFNMLNHGDSITLPVGFPVMNFFHWAMGSYDKRDKDKFEIYIDGIKLSKNDIQVPERMKGAYDKYMKVLKADEEYKRKMDSVRRKHGTTYEKGYTAVEKWRESQPFLDLPLLLEFDSLLNQGNYAWYIWNVKFGKEEAKTIKVNYMVPSGVERGGEYRYMKYLLSTGTGWKGKIEKADINVYLKKVDNYTIEEISPLKYKFDKKAKSIKWSFLNIEPTVDNDIYVRYYNPKERKRWENYKRSLE